MKYRCIVACGLVSLVIGGCSSHQPTDWKATSRKIVATSIDDFENQASRLCPFGFNVVGENLIFVEGRENTRYIHCRND